MIPPLASVLNGLSANITASEAEHNRCRELKEGVPGWSKLSHFLVFRELLRAKPNGRILVTGVYHGLDLRYMAGLAADLGQIVELVGVDTFDPKPSADAPNQGQTWPEAWEAPPPSLEAAQRNCPSATIYVADSIGWMRNQTYLFDVIWLDACHTEEFVREEIRAALRILAPGGILAGDDYWSDAKTFGVDRAVQALLPNHVVLFNRIWLAQP